VEGGDKERRFGAGGAELKAAVKTRKDIFGIVKGGERGNSRKERCFLAFA